MFVIIKEMYADLLFAQKIEQRAVADYDQKLSDMACSLENPDACEACGS